MITHDFTHVQDSANEFAEMLVGKIQSCQNIGSECPYSPHASLQYAFAFSSHHPRVSLFHALLLLLVDLIERDMNY